MKTEVKNDNELIAEFMGGVFYGPDDLDHPNKWWFNKQSHEGYRGDAHHLTLRYNIDWSWLMPVVEKIESLGYATKFRYEAFTSGPENAYHDIEIFSLNDNNGYKRVACCMDRIPKIQAVYKAVVEFIHWYNSQTTSNPEQS